MCTPEFPERPRRPHPLRQTTRRNTQTVFRRREKARTIRPLCMICDFTSSTHRVPTNLDLEQVNSPVPIYVLKLSEVNVNRKRQHPVPCERLPLLYLSLL